MNKMFHLEAVLQETMDKTEIECRNKKKKNNSVIV